MKQIPLTQGRFTIVDDEDYDALSSKKWHFMGGYACTGSGSKIKMHRILINAQCGFVTDHINGNKLDNRKENLRACSIAENVRNQKPRSNKKYSDFKGVTRNKAAKKWQSQIMIERKNIYLGLFDNPKDAAIAYDEAAKKYHQSYARINFK